MTTIVRDSPASLYETGDVPVILIVDDSKSMRVLLREMLAGDEYRIEEAFDGDDALLKFEQLRPDMVLLDFVKPKMDGVALCRKLRETAGGATVPVLIVSMLEDPRSVELVFDAGVTDYVTKPVYMPVLRKRVKYLLKASATERHIRHLAFHDTLTGLPNRMLLSDRLNQSVAQAKRHDRTIAVMFVDLDRFKWVNDTLGHDAGDDLLRIVAARLSACVRDSDTVARQGGDEFVLVLNNLLGPEDVVRVVQKVLDTIQAPISISGHEVRVCGSIGVVIYPIDGKDTKQLMSHADTAMYRAKDGGRNQYRFFTPQMGEEVERQISMVSHLRESIRSPNGFSLYFMPQFSLRDSNVVMIESFVLWNHPTLGALSARDFLPLAKNTGLIRELDERILRLVCENIALWRSQGIDIPDVSVNFSAVHFRENNAVSRIASILEDSGATGVNLVIEISEFVNVSQSDNVGLALNAIKKLGIGLCVNDFGAETSTSTSTLANLARFKIDSVKLDPVIVRGIGSSPRDTMLVRGLLALAASFELDVIANDVETEAQLAILRDLGCDQAQGFVFGQPFAASELASVMARYSSANVQKKDSRIVPPPQSVATQVGEEEEA